MNRLLVSTDGTQFGVQVAGVRVPNVTPHRQEAEALLKWLRRNKVSAVHVMDVVEDWIAVREPMTVAVFE